MTDCTHAPRCRMTNDQEHVLFTTFRSFCRAEVNSRSRSRRNDPQLYDGSLVTFCEKFGLDYKRLGDIPACLFDSLMDAIAEEMQALAPPLRTLDAFERLAEIEAEEKRTGRSRWAGKETA